MNIEEDTHQDEEQAAEVYTCQNQNLKQINGGTLEDMWIQQDVVKVQ
jgi:hypothetical protein